MVPKFRSALGGAFVVMVSGSIGVTCTSRVAAPAPQIGAVAKTENRSKSYCFRTVPPPTHAALAPPIDDEIAAVQGRFEGLVRAWTEQDGPHVRDDLRATFDRIEWLDETLALSLTIRNGAGQPVRFRIPTEWGGGLAPATSLQGIVVPFEPPEAGSSVYVVEADRSDREWYALAPNESVALRVRINWRGTGSRPERPMFPACASRRALALWVQFEGADGPSVSLLGTTAVILN